MHGGRTPSGCGERSVGLQGNSRPSEGALRKSPGRCPRGRFHRVVPRSNPSSGRGGSCLGGKEPGDSMRVLFDQGTPAPLRFFLTGHEIASAHELGWSNLKNGELLSAAEGNFDVLVTTDQNLRYQQNLSGRNLAILVLPTTSWPKLRGHAEIILSELNKIQPGEYKVVPRGVEQ